MLAGVSPGIGKGLTLLLVSHGIKLIINARNTALLKEVKETIQN